jgi:protein-L-isoaspartate(D-aspartate) O-methyltransferase
MVALMTQELGLRGHERVLEIGTGSGYQAAILAELCAQVITIERLAELSQRASRVLTDLGLGNVRCLVGDGSLGWPPEAPYDGVLVTAGAPEIPWGLYDPLAEEGRLVIPVGKGVQTLKTIQKTRGGPRVREVCDCVFVPLIGANAWAST